MATALPARSMLIERAAPAVSARAPLSVRRLSWPDGAGTVAAAWNELQRRSARPLFFQSFEWSRLCSDVFVRAGDGTFEPLILTVHRGAELIGLAPLKIEQRGPVRLAVDLTDPFGQYGDILLAGDADAVVRAVLATVSAIPGVDGLHLRRMRADSAVRDALEACGFAASGPDAAPSVDLRPYATFDDYLKTVNAKSRKNLRNLRNRLSRLGAISHHVYCGGEVREVIERSVDGRLRWLDDHGVPSTAFAHPAFRSFTEAIGKASGRGTFSVLAMALNCGDVPVSLQWGFVDQGRYYAFIAARNPEFDAYSPGRLHLQDVLRTCHERGIETCDFLAPAVPYKLTWTERATDVVDVAVPFTVAGRLWLDLWNRRLRPAIKHRYADLPLQLRRVLRRMAG